MPTVAVLLYRKVKRASEGISLDIAACTRQRSSDAADDWHFAKMQRALRRRADATVEVSKVRPTFPILEVNTRRYFIANYNNEAMLPASRQYRAGQNWKRLKFGNI